MKEVPLFHLAIPVKNLAESRFFYSQRLKLKEGRSSKHWIDYNFGGHQLVIHEAPQYEPPIFGNEVDAQKVPVPHFGLILDWFFFDEFSAQLNLENIDYIISPCIRFQNQPGEQKVLFFKDPSGNALEFKAYKNTNEIFTA
ncbi:VOC family protein [Mesonia sediminis]|uniref:VOC family protein n=1 Tax=Mesonia sediminis TaxID=1703946 RepID=A0ABW5SDW4_9FLAO